MVDFDTPVIVRDSTADDMAAVHAIYAHHVLNGLASFEEVAPSLAEMISRRETVLASELPYVIAEVDGVVQGYAYAGMFRPRIAYRYTIEDSVYLAPGMDGRGLGKALLTELIARCEKGPWRQMIAVIGDSGNHGSIGLHRSLGFHHTGTLAATGFKFGRWVDTVMMQRQLGEGDATLPI
jgi:L-amino acid N-acyltransferase YncA